MYKRAMTQAMNRSFQDILLLQQQQQQQQQSGQQTTVVSTGIQSSLPLSGRVLAPAVSKQGAGVGGVAGGVSSYQQQVGLHALQQQQQQQQKSAPMNAHHLPTLTQHKIRAPISHVPGGVAYHATAGGGEVGQQRTMPTLTPHPAVAAAAGAAGLLRTQNSLSPAALNQSAFIHHHQNKSASGNPASDRPHLPSQQVT